MSIGKRLLTIIARIHQRKRQNGVILLGALVLLLVVSLALGTAASTWSDARRRDREQELLKVGNKYRIAIGQYYNETPGPVKQYPPSLLALLRDDRFPLPRRYLRQLYPDPVTGRLGWGTLEGQGGGVMGIYSLASEKPFKTTNFRPVDEAFEHKKDYADWIFAYIPEIDITQTASAQ